MAAYRHLIPEPVSERDRLWYLRVADDRCVVLRHGDGSPIAGFVDDWQPNFVYTGLGCVHLLDFEKNGAHTTWLVGADGRRLGDKLGDLQPMQRADLLAAIVSRGLARPRGLIGDGIQCIEPALLAGLLGLAEASEPRPQTGLAMLGAPHGLRTQLHFRPGGDASALPEGWALLEGWTQAAGSWRAVGSLSVIETGLLPAPLRHLLWLTLMPVAGGPSGELEIIVNDRAVARSSLDPEWQGDGAELAFWLAPDLLAGGKLRIAFRHSQEFTLAGLKLSARPQMRPAEALPPERLMMRFENLGDNCEFGLVQRHFGAEPIGLLRFAGLRDPRRLIRFLDDDFGRLGEPGSLAVHVIGGEYWIVDTVYGFAAHTFRHTHDSEADEVIRENEIKTAYLKRKFREDLEDGEKILIYKRVVTQDPAEMLALHGALNRFGTVNKLLWVTEAVALHVPGDVEWVGDRLLRGYLGAISLKDANDFDPQAWLRLCRNAFAAFQALS